MRPTTRPLEYRAGRTPYDAEVAYADAMLGQLLARLKAAHALDTTLVVLTADHGESLGDHGETTHGLFAYDSTLAVPLIVNAPTIAAATVDAPVSHVDITPTILDLLGLAAPGPVDGQSLVRAPAPDRPLYFEALDASLTRGWAPLRGIIQGGWKYIDLPDAELYDLGTDPGEQHNRVDRDPRAALLKSTLRLAAGPETAAPPVAIDADAAARLRSLGYSAGSPPQTLNPGDDPKRLVGLNERFNTALTSFDQGQPQAAIAAFLAILRERPDFVAARTSASTALVATGRSREAVDLLREGLRQQPGSAELLVKLGAALNAAGDAAGSIEAFERARRAGDDGPDVLNQLALVYAGSGRINEARTIFRTLIDRNPGAATAWFNLGLFELQNRRRDEAAAAFRRATAIDPLYGDAWNALGAALVDRDTPGAIDAWRRAERLLPREYDLLFNLGMVLADSRTPSEAIPYLRRFEQEAPRDQYASDIARVASTLGAPQGTGPMIGVTRQIAGDGPATAGSDRNPARVTRWSVLVFLLAAVAGAAACRRPGEPVRVPIAAAALRGSNVLLVTIDTLRADHVGAYGSTRGLTPTLDRLAREGWRFEVAHAHVPMTLPSHATIMSGLYPPANGVRDNGAFRFDRTRSTLASTLGVRRLPHGRLHRIVRPRRPLRPERRLRTVRRSSEWQQREPRDCAAHRRAGARARVRVDH